MLKMPFEGSDLTANDGYTLKAIGKPSLKMADLN